MSISITISIGYASISTYEYQYEYDKYQSVSRIYSLHLLFSFTIAVTILV